MTKRELDSCIFTLLVLVIAGCGVPVSQSGSTGGGTNSSTTEIEFSGIDSVDSATQTTLTVNWTHVTGAASYLVYQVANNELTLLTTVTAPTATYTVTDLTAATEYTFIVRLLDTVGLLDSNSTLGTATTASAESEGGGDEGGGDDDDDDDDDPPAPPPTTVAETQFIEFGGTDEQIAIPTTAKIQGGTSMSVVCYARASAAAAQAIMTQWNSGTTQRAWQLGQPIIDGAGKFEVVISGDGAFASERKWYVTNAVHFDNNWHQYAFTWDSGTLKLYVDGAEDTDLFKRNDDTFNSIHAIDMAESTLIGARNGGMYFIGGISQCAIWNSVLTDAELAEIHAAFLPGVAGTTLNLVTDSGNYASSANLIYWGRLGDGDANTASGVLDSSTTPTNGTMENMEDADITAH